MGKCWYLTLMILLCLTHLQKTNAQTVPLSEGLFEFRAGFNQKIINLSERAKKYFDLSKTIIHTTYFNLKKDSTFPRGQQLISVLWLFTDNELPGTNILPLLDDGFHYDNENVDSIYANLRNIELDEVDTRELTIEVTGNMSGVRIHSFSLPIRSIPKPPQILFPWDQASVASNNLILNWNIDSRADGGTIILVESPFDIRRRLPNILWQREHKDLSISLFSDTVSASLQAGKTYVLIAWSYTQGKVLNGEWSHEAYSLDISTFQVGIDPDKQKTFNLENIYPNPFSGLTTISWTQSELYDVSVLIYDLIGREVKRYVANQVTTGQHAVIWDGTNSLGQKLPSGTYILKLLEGREQKTAKIILLR